MQKRKRKAEKKLYKNKQEKKREKYTQALRGLKWAYTKKSDASLELNKAILEAFIFYIFVFTYSTLWLQFYYNHMAKISSINYQSTLKVVQCNNCHL